MRNRRLVALAIAGFTVAAMLAACGADDQRAGASTVLNIGLPNGPQTENHNPFLASSAAATFGYRWMIYEPLAMINAIKPGEPGKPWLATRWEWSDNFRKLLLTIRDNVTFSDGRPMTAEDVAYTFQLRKGNAGLNEEAIPYGEVIRNGNQVTLTFPRSQFVNQTKLLNVFVVPKHIWSALKDPAKDTVKKPVGTGPYTVKSVTPQTTTLQVRGSYWQELPKVKELRYTSYNDNNAQTTALASGATEWSYVFIPNYQVVYVDKAPKHHKLWFPPNLGIHGLWINTMRKPFDSAALRRAMNLVINRDDIFQQGEAGYFYPKVESDTGIPTPAGENLIAPEYQGQKHKVDVEAARKELTGAGFTFDGDTLKDPTGKRVALTLTAPAGWSDYITNLEIIKDNLATIGITATVERANQEAWFKAVDEGDFDATMHWTNSGSLYDMYQNIMDGRLLKPVGTGGVGGNYGRFDSPDATRALEDYANAAGEDTRTASLNALQRIMVEQMPVIPTSASNLGGQYSTRNWVGWPDESHQYAPAQPTQRNALEIVLRLKPAS